MSTKKKITFSVTRYYDPYGDGKSARKVLRRTALETKKTEKQVSDYFARVNKNRNYYQEVTLTFKPYKRVVDFDKLNDGQKRLL